MAAALKAAVTRAADKYSALVQRRPLTTNAAIGFIVATLGDIGCQLAFEHSEYSLKRTIDMGIIRAVVMAPFLHVYFPFLNRLVPGSTRWAVLRRVITDQIIGSPVSITLTFVAAGILQGNPSSILPRIQEQLLPTWRQSVVYWPIAHFINFSYLPVHHQPVYAHVASLYWNAVLSYRANTRLHGPATAAAPTDSGIAAADDPTISVPGEIAATDASTSDPGAKLK
jgi:protein Mpv17